MTESDAFKQYVAAALHELEFAVAHDDAASALNMLIHIGLAEAAPSSPAAHALERTVYHDTLRAKLAGHDKLIARAAANIDTLLHHEEADGEETTGLENALYARSGYQVLLDMKLWPESPLDAFHLKEVDQEVKAQVTAHMRPLVAPKNIPRSHVWWFIHD